MVHHIRSFTLESDVSADLDERFENGQRSRFVNEVLRRELAKDTVFATVINLTMILAGTGFTLGLGL